MYLPSTHLIEYCAVLGKFHGRALAGCKDLLSSLLEETTATLHLHDLIGKMYVGERDHSQIQIGTGKETEYYRVLWPLEARHIPEVLTVFN
jgi:hypothetical protein